MRFNKSYVYIRAVCVGPVTALCAKNVCYLMIVHAHAQLVFYFTFCRQESRLSQLLLPGGIAQERKRKSNIDMKWREVHVGIFVFPKLVQ